MPAAPQPQGQLKKYLRKKIESAWSLFLTIVSTKLAVWDMQISKLITKSKLSSRYANKFSQMVM